MSATSGSSSAGVVGSFYYWRDLQIVTPTQTRIYLRQLVWHSSGVPVTIAVPTRPQSQHSPSWIARDDGVNRVTPILVTLDTNGGLVITWPDLPAIGELHYIDANAGNFFAAQLPGLTPASAVTIP